jgi:8-oxo-dGTP pyrophosphatase MutT (NUDIX family)
MAACTLSAMGVGSSAKALQRSRLSKRRQQVAAVCYRIGTDGIEFLLVQTRSGRWIFPKGGVEPGLTRAQSAALEAFEEAGVHGRIEEIPFTRYFRRTPDHAASRSAQPAVDIDVDVAVAAHLCEVVRLEKPQESNRRPTWFSAEKARQRLIKDRTPEFGAELARVIDRAVVRIDRLRGAPDRRRKDSLQVVYFDLLENRHPLDELRAVALQAHLRRAHHLDASRNLRPPVLRLGSGRNSPAETTHNVTAIDTGRGTGPSKRNGSSNINSSSKR